MRETYPAEPFPLPPRGWPPHVAPPMSPMQRPPPDTDQYGALPPVVAPLFCARCYTPIREGRPFVHDSKLFCEPCEKQRAERCGS